MDLCHLALVIWSYATLGSGYNRGKYYTPSDVRLAGDSGGARVNATIPFQTNSKINYRSQTGEAALERAWRSRFSLIFS